MHRTKHCEQRTILMLIGGTVNWNIKHMDCNGFSIHTAVSSAERGKHLPLCQQGLFSQGTKLTVQSLELSLFSLLLFISVDLVT